MRVVHLIVGLGDGGAEKSLYKLVTSDKSNSHSVVSLTSLGKYGPLLSQSGTPTIAVGWTFWGGLLSFVRLVRFLREEKPEVIHAWMPHAALLSVIVKSLLGIKRVVWSIRASSYGLGLRSLPTRLIVRILAVLSHWVPSKILVVGQRALDNHANIGFSRQTMVCIPNGYSAPIKEGLERWHPQRNKSQEQPSNLVLGMMARWHPQKNHRGLLLAISVMKQCRADWSLKLAGEGIVSSNKELVAEISRLGLADNVVLLGPLQDPDSFYRSLDVHILSSSFGEGFPNVVAESMLNYVPNIVTDVGDSAEIVGETGWVVRPDSPLELAKTIESLFESGLAEIQERGLRASARIKQSYSLQGMVQSHLREYSRRHLVAFPRYSRLGASSRVRMFQYEEILSNNGWEVSFYPFADEKFLRYRYSGRRAWGSVLRSYLRRIRDLRCITSADLVWVEKELIPWAPAWIEKWFISGESSVIYDFDDAIHEQFRESPHAIVRLALSRKVSHTVAVSSGIISGNDTLRSYFESFGTFDTITVPSAIDITKLHPEPSSDLSDNRPFVFGWIGTPVTFRAYVEHLLPMFESIAERIAAEFWVIGAGTPAESTDRVKYHSWTPELEGKLLNSLDVGIMPLLDDPWSRGKCGYKLIQYMAVGKAVIASPVGVNREIVSHGESGYLVRETEGWDFYLTLLSSDRQLSRTLGEKGAERVASLYSTETTGPAIANYFNQIVDLGT